MHLPLDQILEDRGLRVIAVPTDGLCLLHAVKAVLNNDEQFHITTAGIAKIVQAEVRDNIPHYEPFFLMPVRDVLSDLDAYLERGKYNSDLGDIAIAAICNAISVHLTIFEQRRIDEEPSYTIELSHPPSRVESKFNVSLLRSSLPKEHYHYDALVMMPVAVDPHDQDCLKTKVTFNSW